MHVEYNFDHPQAFDILEITRCLDSLKRGNETAIPEYDFATHSRSDTVLKVKPGEVIMFEGILVLHVPEIVERLNMKVRIRSMTLKGECGRECGEHEASIEHYASIEHQTQQDTSESINR